MSTDDGEVALTEYGQERVQHADANMQLPYRAPVDSVAGSLAKADWADGLSYYFGWAELESRGSPDPWAA